LVAAVSLVLVLNLLFSRYLWGDAYYDLYAGRYLIHRGIPHQNLVTAAAHGASWIDQQWLAHVLYYGAWAAGGYPAVAALSAALVTSGFAVLALLMLSRGVPPVRACAWTAAAYAACVLNTWIRAQSFAYLFVPATLWLILADSKAPRLRARTWLVVPVLMLWANTHGSALLGAGLVLLYAGYRVVKALAGTQRQPVLGYLALAAAAAASVICTPYGTGVLPYYRSLIGNPVLASNVPEWAPPNPLAPYCWGFFGLALATAIAVAVAWRRGARPDPLLAGLAVILLALALAAVRNQPWFAFGGSLLAADTLARASAGRAAALSRGFRRAAAGVLAGLALASAGLLAVTPSSQFESLIPRPAIDAAAAVAARNPGLRILTDPWSGSAMLWFHPAMLGRVGFDLRMEQYPQAELAGFFDFLSVRGPGWQRVMRGYGLVVISRSQRPRLARALARLPGWRVVYQDGAGLVVQRQARP
jgi:hypothetical protein